LQTLHTGRQPEMVLLLLCKASVWKPIQSWLKGAETIDSISWLEAALSLIIWRRTILS
jgi:hypothetical protein